MTKLTLLSKAILVQNVKKKEEGRIKFLRGRIGFTEKRGAETDGKSENVAHPTSLMSGQGYRWRL